MSFKEIGDVVNEQVTFPVALRNQPQWTAVALFLNSQLRREAQRRRVPLACDGVAVARSVPHGNHGDNLRSVTK
jgi:hypothetical protein